MPPHKHLIFKESPSHHSIKNPPGRQAALGTIWKSMFACTHCLYGSLWMIHPQVWTYFHMVFGQTKKPGQISVYVTQTHPYMILLVWGDLFHGEGRNWHVFHFRPESLGLSSKQVHCGLFVQVAQTMWVARAGSLTACYRAKYSRVHWWYKKRSFLSNLSSLFGSKLDGFCPPPYTGDKEPKLLMFALGMPFLMHCHHLIYWGVVALGMLWLEKPCPIRD